MKQLISWNEETKTISVIGVFSEKDICGAIREYVKKRITSLYSVTEKEAQDMIEKGGCADFDDGRMAAQIVISGNGYREYLQAADIPSAPGYKQNSNKENCTGTGQDYYGAELVAYTDGSYNKGTGEFGAGIVMFAKNGGDPDFYMEKGRAAEGENGWQVNGEIAAARKAILKAVNAGAKSLEIHCDYEGVAKWADKKWKRNKAYTREYAAYVEEARKKLPITFIHVKGHSGDKWNDKADRLARQACGIQAE